MIGISKTIFQYLLATDGVNQSQRSESALDPATVKIDGRTLSELVRFVIELSSQVRYYDGNNIPQGDWKPFFDGLLNGSEVMSDVDLQIMLAVKEDLSPHLALLMAFFRIYSIAVNDLNSLTKKRLDYYFEEVLRLQRIKPQPDAAHVLFELIKNAKNVLIAAGTLLDAGKTNTGLPLHYAVENEVVINHAVVDMIRSSFTDFKPGNRSMVFKAPDATKILNETATAWRPFGSRQLSLSPESRSMEPVYFGWAIASPNLFLAEGKRTVKLSIKLRSFKGTKSPKIILTSTISVMLTGEKGWLTDNLDLKAELTPDLLVQNPEDENPFTLEIVVVLEEKLPAITKFNETTHLASFPTIWPVIRVLVKPESYIAGLLSQFRVENVGIEVEALGMKNLVLQNDVAVQANDKPILPFGSNPLISSNFYIGSKEAFSKTLTSVAVNLEWQDPPESFISHSSHYENYGNPHILHSSFSTAVDLLRNKNWNVRLVNDAALFNPFGTSLVQGIAVNKSTFANQTVNAPFTRITDLELANSLTNNLLQGFIRLVLKGPTRLDLQNLPEDAPFEAFGHKTFPFAYTQQVILLSKYDGIGPEPGLPKPPYIPTLKSVSLDYTAKDVFIPNDPKSIDQYFVEDVFGPAETGSENTALLIAPQPGNGALYIGLKNADAPQTVSLLLQVEEGSVEGKELLKSSDLGWSYLAGNQWQNIEAGDVLEESSDGFQKPGLIRLNIGNDASDSHSLMPKNLRWLRVSVKDNPEGAAAISSIRTQAAKAKLVLPDGIIAGYEEHLSAPLAAESISKMVVKIASIKKVIQPFHSFGGRNIESDTAFYRRVSERLRHKNRAVSGWDFERLVLQSFPEIYKIKCLSHSENDQSFKPGDISLIVVPDWRKRPAGDPLQPRVNQNRLREIANFISSNYVSPFVNVHVSNPNYETLLVDCKVSFHPEFDPGYYSIVLEEDIRKFLSPWAYEEGQDIVFGGKVHASEILAFIEGRKYIDFIIDFELYHRYVGIAEGGISDMEISLDFIVGDSPDPSISITSSGAGGRAIGVDFTVGVPVEVAAAIRPDSILVSNAVHRIQTLQANMYSCQGTQQIGIGQMIIGLDFVPIS